MSAWSGDPSLFAPSSGFPTTILLVPPRGRRPRSVAERVVAVRRGLPGLLLAAALGAAVGGAWPAHAPRAWEATAVLRLPPLPSWARELSRPASSRAAASSLVDTLQGVPPEAAGAGAVVSLRPLDALDAARSARLALRVAGPDPQALVPALTALGERARADWAARMRALASQARGAIVQRIADAGDAQRAAEGAIVAMLVAPGDLPHGPSLRLVAEPIPPGRSPATRAAEPLPADGPAAPPAGSLRLDEADPMPEDDLAPAAPGDGTRLPPPAPAMTTSRPSFHRGTPLGAALANLDARRQAVAARRAALQADLATVDRLVAGDATITELPAWSAPPAADATRPIPVRSGLPVLGAMAGLLLGLLAVLAREAGTDRLRDERDVRWSLGVPVLGELPPLSTRARRAMAGDTHPA